MRHHTPMKIMNSVKLFREYINWRYDQRRLCAAFNSLLSLELLPYTYGDCACVVATRIGVPLEAWGELTKVLYERSGRGKVTIMDALQVFVTSYKDAK
jgi:hypothetical protein